MDEGCVGLIIVIVLLVIAFKYWYVSLPIVAVGVIAFFVDRAKKEEEKRRAEEQARQDAERARLQRHADNQRALRREMNDLGQQSLTLFTSMPERLAAAERYLSRAEIDFQERAFAPFWDAIERAVNSLGTFDAEAQQLKQLASKYLAVVKKYEDAPPRFPLATSSIAALRVGSGTTDRMQSIVRSAQRDFQFASIYEQRKTNQILAAGFKSLAQALEGMSYQIAGSINELANSVDTLTATVGDSVGALHSQVAQASERSDRFHDQIIDIAAESASRERNALEMLDNIQRRRKPS